MEELLELVGGLLEELLLELLVGGFDELLEELLELEGLFEEEELLMGWSPRCGVERECESLAMILTPDHTMSIIW